jgi:hypothetical protein|tara:strand:- start:270 stop:470 length:201 start_codon:yes stop_codon:yes gene_type:complete
MCRKVDHPPCAAGLTETPPLKAKGDKLLVMAGITANPQKAMLQAATLQIVIEVTNRAARSLFAPRG